MTLGWLIPAVYVVAVLAVLWVCYQVAKVDR
jgi:hypothetical protein